MIKKILLGIVVFILTVYATFNLAPSIYFKIGKTAFDNKNYPVAEKNFSNALIYNPYNSDCRYYYVKTISNLQSNYEMQKRVFKIANDNIDDSAKTAAKRLLGQWKNYILSNVGDNFIEQAPQNMELIRWNKNSFPLSVFVSAQKGLPKYYYDAIYRALLVWSNSISFIKFKKTDDINSADIIIEFKSMSNDVCEPNMPCQFVLGMTSPSISGRRLVRMTISLYNQMPNGNFFSEYDIYGTVLHELGHALGIMGHSYSTNDVMYASATQSSNNKYLLSKKDINTINLLYMLEPTITDIKNTKPAIFAPVILGNDEQIFQRKITEALNYIKKYPNISVGYVDLSLLYRNLKEYKKAIKALQKASEVAKNDEEKFSIYYNLSGVYFEIKDYDSALNYAKKAKNISNSAEVNELISLIDYEMKK